MAHRAASPAALPDDDDQLSEFLLRLPPQSSSLPRSSLVCKRWHRLVTDPGFCRRFRARHRDAPLIAVFEDQMGYPFFRSVMDPPDLIPAERFRPPLGGEDTDDGNHDQWSIFGCRHGRVLLFNRIRYEIVLWDPLTGDHRTVPIPFEDKEKIIWNGAVLCAAAGDPGHVHGGFSSCLFKVVLVGVNSNHTGVFAYSYSSETGQWNTIVSTAVPFLVFCVVDPGIFVGSALYWMPIGLGHGILKFDLDAHSLALIKLPSSADGPQNCYQILLTEDGGLGLVIVSRHSLQIWERKVCSEGVARWVLWKTEKLYKILELQSENDVGHIAIIGPQNFGKLKASSSIIPTLVSMLQNARIFLPSHCL